MNTIVLNPTLEYQPRYKSKMLRMDGTPVPEESRCKKIYEKTIDPNNAGKYNFRTQKNDVQKEFTISASFDDKSGDLFHANYIDYLVECYAVHHSIVLTPDILWYTILGEIAKEVVSDPKLYEAIFTKTPGEKQNILVPTGDVTELPLDLIIEALKERTPVDPDLFLPEFTTTDLMSSMAMYASFAEMCSPYYNYMTFMCGYPAIKILGDMEDYEKILAHLLLVDAAFDDSRHDKVRSYLDKVGQTLVALMDAITEQDIDFLSKILTTKKCGSGSQIELDGWWVKNFYFKDYTKSMPHNVPSSIARVPYENLESGRKFTVNFGLFYSNLEDGFMVPKFGYVRNEIKK